MFALVLAVLSAMFGAVRMTGDKSIIFQALAHVYVGGLFGAGLVSKDRKRLYLGLAIGLTVLEVICFAVSRLT